MTRRASPRPRRSLSDRTCPPPSAAPAQIDPDRPENRNPRQSKEDRKIGITREWLPIRNLHTTLAMYESQGWGVFAGACRGGTLHTRELCERASGT